MSAANSVALNWALSGLAGVLSIGRYLIRGLLTQLSYWDDFFHLLALLVLIAHGVTNQITNDAKTNLQVLLAAKHPKTSPDVILATYQHLLVLNTVNNCFLYLVFWLVKFSFLMFYRFLFNVDSKFKKWWWGVFVFTGLTLWVPLGGVLATCSGASTIAAYTLCNAADNPARYQKLEYTCAIIVASDLAIMALPLWMLKGLRLHWQQKLALGFVFSFGLVIVALDILRTVEAIQGNQIVYTILEINFAVIISTLPTYRSLLNLHQHRLRSSARGSRSRSRGMSISYLASKVSNTLGSKSSNKFSNLSNRSNAGAFDRSINADDGQPLKGDLESRSMASNFTHHNPYSQSIDSQIRDPMELDALPGRLVTPPHRTLVKPDITTSTYPIDED